MTTAATPTWEQLRAILLTLAFVAVSYTCYDFGKQRGYKEGVEATRIDNSRIRKRALEIELENLRKEYLRTNKISKPTD